MTPLILLAAAAAAPSTPPFAADEAKLKSCVELTRSEPERALQSAGEWRGKGGGPLAGQCAGLAYVALERWAEAATVFEQAAAEAEAAQDPRRADLWAQAGNSWLAEGNAPRARKAFDAALATALLAPELRGEVHLDRARAVVALGDVAAGRADIQKGLELVPADPFAWYLSAALARKQNDLARARADIAKAVELAPDDAAVLLEAGNIAGLSGELDAARGLYTRAARAAPQSEAGRAAQAALAANPAEAVPTPPPAS